MYTAYDTKIKNYVTADEVDNYYYPKGRFLCPDCKQAVKHCYGTVINSYFKHYDGNNGEECDEYDDSNMGGYSEYSGWSYIESHQDEMYGSDSENIGIYPYSDLTLDFYYDKKQNTFKHGLRISEAGFQKYENSSIFIYAGDIKITSIPINSSNFSPCSSPSLFSVKEFAYNYKLEMHSPNACVLPSLCCFYNDKPTIFRALKSRSNEKLYKMVKGEILNENQEYLFVFTNINSVSGITNSYESFTTLNKTFHKIEAKISDNKNLRNQLEKWGFKINEDEDVTILWPPVAIVDDYDVKQHYAVLKSPVYIYVNWNDEDNTHTENPVKEINIEDMISIERSNIDIVISKVNFSYKYSGNNIEDLDYLKDSEKIDDQYKYYLFNSYGVRRIENKNKIDLTYNASLIGYKQNYKKQIFTLQKQGKSYEEVFFNIIKHYKRMCFFNENIHTKYEKINRYITQCYKKKMINVAAYCFLKENINELL